MNQRPRGTLIGAINNGADYCSTIKRLSKARAIKSIYLREKYKDGHRRSGSIGVDRSGMGITFVLCKIFKVLFTQKERGILGIQEVTHWLRYGPY